MTRGRRISYFLIVDDNPLIQRALTATLQRYGVCHGAASCEEALLKLEKGPWDGFIFDVQLEDGSGIDVLATARRTWADTPAIILTGTMDRDTINRAASLNARFVCKPCGSAELAPFVSDVLTRTTGDRFYAATELARHRYQLSPREAEILDATLRGKPRDEYIEASGISVNTYKSHVRKILDKSDYENLASLAIDLLGQH